MSEIEEDFGAIFSDDRRWRYSLHRIWDRSKPMLMVIGLNPSTADETKDDPTVRRCLGIAYKGNFGGIFMMNLFAIRGTDPRILKIVDDPVGLLTDEWLLRRAGESKMILSAWGNHGLLFNRQEKVLLLLSRFDIYFLGLTKQGAPRHPLYLSNSILPKAWRMR